MVDEREMSDLGDKTFRELLRKTPTSGNISYNMAVRNVSDEITRDLKYKHVDWEFVVFKSSVANAFALPGGKIGINTGLFKYIKNEAELAMVIGHEVTHVIARHASEGYGREIYSKVAGTALQYSTEDKRIHDGYALLSHVGMTLRYSRAQEYEADYIGLELACKAGYPPELAIKFFERLAQAGNSEKLEFLSTHPDTDKRIQRLRDNLDHFQEIYNNSPRKKYSPHQTQSPTNDSDAEIARKVMQAYMEEHGNN